MTISETRMSWETYTDVMTLSQGSPVRDHGTGATSGTALGLTEQPGLAPAIMIADDSVQSPGTPSIEIAEDTRLHPVGDDTYQDRAVQMLRSRLAHQFASPYSKAVEVELRQCGDLCSECVIDEGIVACSGLAGYRS